MIKILYSIGWNDPQIVESNPEEEEMVRRHLPEESTFKFCAFLRGEMREKIMIVFEAMYKHDESAVDFMRDAKINHNNFLAAGLFSMNNKGMLNVRFGSDTCELHFGYDRPANDDEQSALLAEIKEAIQAKFIDPPLQNSEGAAL